MEEMSIIRRSDSPWASPLHMLPNNSGGWIPCGDCRRLNDITVPDKYPVPHIPDLSSQLAGATLFSKIDLVRGYHQIPVAPADISKTAVITPFGLFEFLRTPFGLRNAAQAFQCLMDTVCKGLTFVFLYLDDILVGSATADDHVSHIRTLFERLASHGLVINLSKCQFGTPTIDYLGHHITGEGAIPLSAKVDAIRTFERPTTVKGLQQFAGMVNVYHHCLRRYTSEVDISGSITINNMVDYPSGSVIVFADIFLMVFGISLTSTGVKAKILFVVLYHASI